MPNVLTAGLAYNPYFYPREALRILYKRLGMAFYVKRDLAAGKGSGTGDTVQVRRASTFSATNMPIAEASFADVQPQYDNLVISSWMGQGFKLTDKERTLTPAAFVSDHLAPVANSIADQIDQNLASLSLECPWQALANASPNAFKDFPDGRKVLLDNKNPIINPADYAYMTDSVLQQRYESDATFAAAHSDADAGQLQRSGQLGSKWGFRIFPNQNAVTKPADSSTGGGTVTGVNAKDSATLNVATITGTTKRGTTFTIAGFSQAYAVTADAAGGTVLSISPKLQVATAGGEAITYDKTARTSVGLMFHREAFALVMQPLEDAGPGIISSTVVDDVTGLSLRFRVWGSGGLGATIWALDALWGYKTLNPNLAVKIVI
jgi:coat protein Gp5